MEAPITARNLTKTFRGVVAVNVLDIRVERVAVYGLIGRNGAGRTTTRRLFLGRLRRDHVWTRMLGTRCRKVSALVHTSVL